MSYEGIHYYNEDSNFTLEQPQIVSHWIKSVFEQEAHQLLTVNFIFCSDIYLHEINVKYLDHDTFTDVITFAYDKKPIEGDIFISIERVKENSEIFKVDFILELYRVMIHGILHLMGFDDKTDEEKEQMRAMENKYLLLLNLTPN